jgi:uncharacterized iron-regulated protein
MHLPKRLNTRTKKMNIADLMKPGNYSLSRKILLLSSLSLAACNPSQPTSSEAKPDTSTIRMTEQASAPTSSERISSALASELEATLTEAVNQALALSEASKSFIATPSEKTHTSLQQQYQRAHSAYRLAAVVVHLSSGQVQANTMIDAFPMLPGYLDSVEGYPNSGLIHSEISIDLATLQDEHQFSDELYLTLGFHPFEFILNGDPSEPIPAWRRFVVEGTDKQKAAAQRRAEYLLLIAEALRTDIQQELTQWQQTKSIRLAFLKDQREMESYLETETQHTGAEGAERIKAFWLSLDALQATAESTMTAEEPGKTSLSDNSSPESPEQLDGPAPAENAQ